MSLKQTYNALTGDFNLVKADEYNPAMYQVGRYFATVDTQNRITGLGSSNGATLPSATNATFSLFEVKLGVTISEILVQLSSQESGKFGRIAIAKPAADGSVGVIVHETAEFSVATGGPVTITENVTLPKGFYYFIFVTDSTTAVLNTWLNGALPLSYPTPGLGAVCMGTFAHTFTDPIPDNPTGQTLGSTSTGTISATFRISALL